MMKGDRCYGISFHPVAIRPQSSLTLQSGDGQEAMDGKVFQVIQQGEHASPL